MVEINPSLCTGCGLCASNCAVHAIVQSDNGTYFCNKTWCFACGQCVALCPTGAPSMPGLEAPIPYDSASFDLEPQTLLNAMRFRRSIRRFTGGKATRQELELLLEAGRCAPTSTNSQTVGFTVLDEEFEAIRPKIWKAFARISQEKGRKLLLRRYENYLAHPDQPDTLFYGGNQMIVVTSERPVDGGLALANMELMAHALGLGALYCGFATRAIDSDPALREYFGLTETRTIDSCLIVGRTDLCFQRTAPRNPARVQWR
ncbi:MAG: 4Fe-4S binding protein [Oscillospiraceae bacterium]|jgi:nitroreductase/NAD-dependent dihydropyrimidine dehydrogenase PreA subunit|nr:4Fe-4S binding protein [Oscillospiraceae bacterium]